MTPREPAAIVALRAALPLLLEAVLLALHFVIPRGSAWHEPAFVPFALPMFLASLGGARTAAPALLLPFIALADDVVEGDAATLAFEAVFLAVVALGCWLTARRVDEAVAENDRIRAETATRASALKSTWGTWQSVARTRMGAYTTGIEERFLDEALGGQAGGVVVDVGSASGRLHHALARHADHVLATDIDRHEVYATAAHPNVTLTVVGDLPSLPLRDGSADAVVAIQVPAVSDQAWFREECGRVLRPGGAAIVTLYNARSYKGVLTRVRRWLRRAETLHWDDLYYRFPASEQLRQWRDEGFQPERLLGYYWTPLSRRSDSRWVAAGIALESMLGLQRLTGVSPWLLVELRRPRQA